VAAGRYDGFWERRLKSWDMAAGLIIVREAGGMVESINPANNIIESGEVICAAETIFEKFSRVIRSKNA
jgi:myo-inositol-1(or 4)-monophosphatase